jgi:hypothetical protein
MKHRTTQQDERDRDAKVMNNRATGRRRKHDQATVWSKREEDKERQEVDGYKGKGKQRYTQAVLTTGRM